jgi:hypothetical protein
VWDATLTTLRNRVRFWCAKVTLDDGGDVGRRRKRECAAGLGEQCEEIDAHEASTVSGALGPRSPPSVQVLVTFLPAFGQSALHLAGDHVDPAQARARLPLTTRLLATRSAHGALRRHTRQHESCISVQPSVRPRVRREDALAWRPPRCKHAHLWCTSLLDSSTMSATASQPTDPLDTASLDDMIRAKERQRRRPARAQRHPFLFALMTLTAAAELGLTAFLITAGNETQVWSSAQYHSL